jgi:hypothetical protein
MIKYRAYSMPPTGRTRADLIADGLTAAEADQAARAASEPIGLAFTEAYYDPPREVFRPALNPDRPVYANPVVGQLYQNGHLLPVAGYAGLREACRQIAAREEPDDR